jgi:4-hydroxy-tetrahydrodipicolinate synthase
MTQFTGIWVPLVTPFQRGELDLSALKKLALGLADAGVAGLVVCGSTGEAAALDEDEQLAVLDAVLDAVPGLPVAMGLAANNMQAALRRQEQIQRRPIAGLLVPPPYYIRPSQEGLLHYFYALADAASVPLILYNIPYRTGVNIELATLRRLARHERIVALKDCGGDTAATMALIVDGALDVLAGEDQQLLSTLCLGGSGGILASAHIRPDLFVRLAAHVQAGELASARALFYRLLPLIRLLFEEANPGPLKTALSLMGRMEEGLRLPMQGASATMKEKLAPELRRLDCLP